MDIRQAPYPSDTLAKGWRFELDLERVMQSDTWALAAPEIRPWLLMLWTTAWQQKPCGSMPSEDALIAARLGMPAKLFAKAKVVLLRGWWKAADGRLYQDTLVERVLEMLSYKQKEKQRKSAYRARASSGSPDLSHGTDMGQTWDSTGSDATGTGTGTSTGKPTLVAKDEFSSNTHSACVSPGEVCKAMKAMGIGMTNPGHNDLVMLINAGAEMSEFTGAAQSALEKNMGFAYAIGIAKKRREDAANSIKTLHHGAMPAAKSTEPEWRTEQRNRTQQAVPNIAERTISPTEFFDVEAKNVTSIALGR